MRHPGSSQQNKRNFQNPTARWAVQPYFWSSMYSCPASKLATACGLLTSIALAGTTASAGTLRCDPVLADRPAVLDKLLPAPGPAPVDQSLQLPSLTPVIVFARERGTDIILELVDSNGHTVARADNPVQGSGIQRVAFTTDTNGHYTVRLLPKQELDGTGHAIQLRVVALGSAASDTCAEIHRLLAKADGALAREQQPAQPAAKGATPEPTAADTYQMVASRLAAAGPSMLLAQARHAAAAQLHELEDWAHAEKWAASALETYIAVNDAYGAARARTVRAAALMDIAVSPASKSKDSVASSRDTLARARALLRESARFYAGHRQKYDEAAALNYIGLAYYYEGADASAIHYCREALQRYVALGNRLRQAQTLQNIATFEMELGRLKDAIGHFGQVLQMIGPSDASPAFALILNSRAYADSMNRTVERDEPAA
jgi:tetratricopeptide (TPR) repeat protein